MRKAHGVHVHGLHQFHVVDVSLRSERASCLWPEAVTVHTTYVHLLSVDVKSVACSRLYCAEAEFVLLDVQRLAVLVDECEAHFIAVGRFCCPQFRTLHAERNVGFVAACPNVCGVLCHLLAAHVTDSGLHLCAFERVVKQHIGVECAVGLGVNGCALDVDGRFADDEHRAEDAAEVPVVGTALGKIHTGVGALLAHSNFKQVFLFAEEHAVAHVVGDAIECSLVHRAGLTLVYLHLSVGHRGFENELDVMVCPFFGQGELILIHAFLIGNAVGKSLSIELHAILIVAEALKLPARGDTNLGPLARVVTTGAEEVPLHHVVASASAQILALRVDAALGH